jgi:hypothetical protein
MGVVANPVPQHGFDGKVLLKQVSETVTASKVTYLKLISDDYTKNAKIHCTWCSLVAASNGAMFQHDLTVKNVIDLIVETWNLDDVVPQDCLVLRFRKIKLSRNSKWVTDAWVTMEPRNKLLGTSKVGQVQTEM